MDSHGGSYNWVPHTAWHELLAVRLLSELEAKPSPKKMKKAPARIRPLRKVQTPILHWPLNIQTAGAVSKTVFVDSQLVEHAQQQVRHRRMHRSDDMPIPLQLAASAAQQNQRQRIVIVLISVAHAAAVKNHRMIQHRSVAFLDRSQLIDEIGKPRHMVLVDLGE